MSPTRWLLAGGKPQCHLFILLHHGRPSTHSVIFKAAINKSILILTQTHFNSPWGSAAVFFFFLPLICLSDFFCQLPTGTCDLAGSRRETADMHGCKSASVKEHKQSVWGAPGYAKCNLTKGHSLHKIRQRNVCSGSESIFC